MNNSFSSDASPVSQSGKRKKPTPYGGAYNTRAKNSVDVSESKEKFNDKGERENLMKLMRLRSTRGVIANNFCSDSASIFNDFDEEDVPILQGTLLAMPKIWCWMVHY